MERDIENRLGVRYFLLGLLVAVGGDLEVVGGNVKGGGLFECFVLEEELRRGGAAGGGVVWEEGNIFGAEVRWSWGGVRTISKLDSSSVKTGKIQVNKDANRKSAHQWGEVGVHELSHMKNSRVRRGDFFKLVHIRCESVRCEGRFPDIIIRQSRCVKNSIKHAENTCVGNKTTKKFHTKRRVLSKACTFTTPAVCLTMSRRAAPSQSSPSQNAHPFH